MIKLNVKNGSFEFYGVMVKYRSTIKELLMYTPSENFELWVDNGRYKTYRLSCSNGYILLIKFYDNFAYGLEIYSRGKEVLGDSLKKVLNKIGGEGNYSWGIVRMNMDIKAGYRSIFIDYTFSSS